jgi:hypothetical protein
VLRSNNTAEFRRDQRIRRIARIGLQVSASAAIAFVLASRRIGIAHDDENYLSYFASDVEAAIGAETVRAIDEPLWLPYATSLGSALGPEAALRTTVGLSAFAFLLASFRLIGRRWPYGLALFLLIDTMAVQMFYNQIRQGFALAIFTSLACVNVPFALAAALAAMVHSSFAVVAVAAVLVEFASYFRSPNRLAIGGATIVATASDALVRASDLGRRASVYNLTGALNVYFYILYALYTVPAVALLLRKPFDKLHTLALCVTIIALALTLDAEFGGRVMYLSTVLVGISLARATNSTRSALVAALWMVTQIAIQVRYGTKIGVADSWLGRWGLIFGFW